MSKPHVCLAIMSNAKPELLQRAVDSARQMIDSACVMIAPRAYHLLPEEGFGYCCLETRVAQTPWEGYAKTRTKLYEAAGFDPKVEWILMMDADDVFMAGSKLPDLEIANGLSCDAFLTPVEFRMPNTRWRWTRTWHLLRARAGFTWEGSGSEGLHEKLVIPYDRNVMRHDQLVYHFSPDGLPPKGFSPGGRSFESDVEILRVRREGQPLDTRSAFFYAQSLKDAGRSQEAFDAFAHRARMIGGSDEETFWSKLWMGKLATSIGEDPVRFYQEAHRHTPARAEPLYALGAHYLDVREFDLSRDFFTRASECAYPKDATSFVEVHCYSERAQRDAGIGP